MIEFVTGYEAGYVSPLTESLFRLHAKVSPETLHDTNYFAMLLESVKERFKSYANIYADRVTVTRTMSFDEYKRFRFSSKANVSSIASRHKNTTISPWVSDPIFADSIFESPSKKICVALPVGFDRSQGIIELTTTEGLDLNQHKALLISLLQHATFFYNNFGDVEDSLDVTLTRNDSMPKPVASIYFRYRDIYTA
jgi:hypothetical protein